LTESGVFIAKASMPKIIIIQEAGFTAVIHLGVIETVPIARVHCIHRTIAHNARLALRQGGPSKQNRRAKNTDWNVLHLLTHV
jgi:hypothetical protein